MNIQELSSWIPLIGAVIIFWRMGGNKASSEVIITYRERVDQLTKEVSNLTAKVGELTGALKEKNDRIKTLEQIISNRNPELETFMKTILDQMQSGSEVSTQARKYMEDSTEYFQQIKNLLSIANQNRELKRK